MTTVMIWLKIKNNSKSVTTRSISNENKREKLETFYKVDMLELAVHFDKHRWYKSEHSIILMHTKSVNAKNVNMTLQTPFTELTALSTNSDIRIVQDTILISWLKYLPVKSLF